MGLYGVMSPLPSHLTEWLLRLENEWQAHGVGAYSTNSEMQESEPVRAFIDILHHRLYALWYGSWRKYRFNVNHRADGRDPITRCIGALSGEDGGVNDGQRLSDMRQWVRRLCYAGLASQKPRSASVLRGVLVDFFDNISVCVEQFVARTMTIPPAHRFVLGGRSQAPRVFGRGLRLGLRLRDRASTVGVILGPMSLDQYRRFLPGRPCHDEINSLCARFAPVHLVFQLTLRLLAEEVPSLVLCRDKPAQLGWTAFLGTSRLCEQSMRFRPQPAMQAASKNQGTRNFGRKRRAS